MHDRPLHQAVTRHDAQSVIQKLKSSYPSAEKLKEINDKGLTLLQLAAREGEIDLVLLLISHNAVVDQVQDFKHHNPYVVAQAKATAMQLAAERGHRLVAEILLISGASKEKVLKEATKSGNKFLEGMVRGLRPRESTLSYMLFWAIQNYSVTTNASRIFAQLVPYFKNPVQTTQSGESKEVKRSTSRAIAMSLETKEVSQILPANNLQNMVSGMIQLVAREGKPHTTQIVKELLRLAPERSDEARHMTAGYWAAMNDNYDLFAFLCKADEEVAALTFHQLSEYAPKKFASYEGMMNMSAGIDGKFTKLRRARLNSHRELDDNSLMAYALLARGESLSFRVDKELQGRSVVVRHAMKQFNFVVLVEISKLYDNFDAFVPFLKNQDDIFAAFYLARNSRDSLSVIKTFAEEKSLDDWIRFSSTRMGLMQQLISRSLWINNKTDQTALISALASVGPEIHPHMLQREQEMVGLRCMADYYSQESRIAALLSFSQSLSECIADVVDKDFSPDKRVKDQEAAQKQVAKKRAMYHRDVIKSLYEGFAKIGISISTPFDQDEMTFSHVFLPDRLWKYNFSYLGPYDQLKLSKVSKRLYHLFKGGVIESNEMVRLRGMVNAIDRMSAEIERYTRTRSIWSNRLKGGWNEGDIWFWFGTLLSLGLMIGSSVEVQDWQDVAGDLRSRMDNLRPLNNPHLYPRNRTTSCTQLSLKHPTYTRDGTQYELDNKYYCDPSFTQNLNITAAMIFCLGLCGQYVENDHRENWTVGVILGSVFSFFMMLGVIGWFDYRWQTGDQRFQRDPLSNYPQSVRNEVRKVMLEARAISSEAFNAVTDVTRLNAIIDIARDERLRLEGLLNNLRHVKVEEVVEHKESKEVEKPKSSKNIRKPKLQEEENLLDEGMLKRSRYGSMNPSF